MTADALERIACSRGDITREPVDAIVNAAGGSLRGGGGVDGAIHRAAGPQLLAECVRRYPEGCPTGEARITGGHDLAARFVIHTVGPVWEGGTAGEVELLAACFAASLALAAENGVRTVAFPAISTGVYGYPVGLAATVTLRALAAGLARHTTIERARIVLYSDGWHDVFRRELERMRAG